MNQALRVSVRTLEADSGVVRCYRDLTFLSPDNTGEGVPRDLIEVSLNFGVATETDSSDSERAVMLECDCETVITISPWLDTHHNAMCQHTSCRSDQTLSAGETDRYG
jgi:hypothetical protein